MNGNTCLVAADCALCVNKEIFIVKREITVVNSHLQLQTLGKSWETWEESRTHVAARTSGHVEG